MSCITCTGLILAFFEAEVFGHNWGQYSQYASPQREDSDSKDSPTLHEAGIFREDGTALQEYPIWIPHDLIRKTNAATLGQSQIRTLKASDAMSYVLEGVLPEGYLNGVPTVDLLRLLVRHASTLRRCQVDPGTGLDLFCVTLEGTLKLDVWVNAGTASASSPAEFDRCLGTAIQAILALPRPGMITREDSYYWGVESARLIGSETTAVQLGKSLVFTDAAERIRILARVVDTTMYGRDLLGMMSLLDKEWPQSTGGFKWKQLIHNGLHSMAGNFKQTPSGYLAFFRHKVNVLIPDLVGDPYL